LAPPDANTFGSTNFPKNEIPMIAVIFESWPKPGKKDAYLDMAARLMPLVKEIDGFISVERFESVSQPGKMVALSFWRDEEAVANWRNIVEHRQVQEGSRKTVFDDYRLRVAHVVRDYGRSDRHGAPADSVAAHE
jgi:heme-degrading monooxygenase HmoA